MKQTGSRPEADRKQTGSRPEADRKQTGSRPPVFCVETPRLGVSPEISAIFQFGNRPSSLFFLPGLSTKSVPHSIYNGEVRPLHEEDRKRGGWTGAISTLYRAHHGRIVRLCRLLLHDPPEADEVAQDVFLKLLKTESVWDHAIPLES